ncbi:MAG: ABC transporter substrate-binding protein [Sulfolobales archaeon]|nr:ABC transporter substrate-binding protein [Sulfolobales archaeon]
MNLRRAISRITALVITAVVVVAVAAAVAIYIVSVPPPPVTPTPTPTPIPTPTPTTPVVTPAPLKPALHTQVLYIISDDELTRISLYKAGVADIATVTPARWKDVNLTPVDGHRLLLLIDKEKPRLTIQYVLFNTMREPFNIPEVRQALAYTVPYDTVLGQIFGGLYTYLHTIVPKGLPGYTEYGIIKYEFSEAKAREIIGKLKERGFDPAKYTITVIYNLGNTARAQIAALLQNFWTRLGFKVFVETYSWPEFLDRVDHFNYDVALIGWIPDYLDPDNYLMPFVWGGAEFKELKYYDNVATGDVGKYISKVERAVETEKYVVVVGPKGTGATYAGPTGKPLIVVSYVLDEEKTGKNWEKPVAFVTIGAAGWKDVPVSALVKISRMILDAEIREAIINAAVRVFNNEAVMVLLGQAVTGRNHGSWVLNMYYPLTASARYDLVYETPDAPVKDTGVLGIKNDPQTMVIATIGWPDTFDPAKSYESFGWEIFWQIYSKPVTYRYEEVEPEPELAVAWAFSKDATELYFVIRGNTVAYDPWNDRTYPIDATDVLFSAWRVVRLNLPGSAAWMFFDFIDMNASQVLTEEEFKQVLTQGLVAVYRGKEVEVKSLDELLKFFGYQGPTAGVVKFKLYFPYPPILHIFTTAIASVIPMEYALGDRYAAALADSRNGKDPSAWAKYVVPGEDDATYRLLKDKPVSTGPYYVTDYKEGSYILLKLNRYYWNATLWEKLYGYKP